MPDAIPGRALRSSILFVVLIAGGAFAQTTPLISGQNINMVSGTEFPDGDPFLQRQNEPTIGVSTRNELHLMGGSNDYRAVDLPGLPEGKTTGDSWISSYFSYDGGGRWTSTLLPGYPQDPLCDVPDGTQPGHILCGYEASADPVIRPGTHGLFYYSGIAFTRSDNPPSAGFVNTYIDLNNDERGDTIKFVRTTIFDENADGSSFIDKPWIAVDKPRDLTTTIIDVPTDNGVVTQEVQCGNVYAAWARIQGEGTAATESQIMFAKSEDCGASFSIPKQLTVPNTINQGAAIAVSPLDGEIQVAWRQFANATFSCVRKGNYWRKNPEAWPVDEIELAGYTLLSTNRGNIIDDGDDTDDDFDDDDMDDDHEEDADWEHDESETKRPPKLLRQLLAAWLNVLAGAESTEIRETLDAAEAWLVENSSGNGNKAKKKEGKRLHKTLRRFNKGQLGVPKCDDVQSMGPTGANPDAIIVTTSNDFGETFSDPVTVVSSNDFYFPFEQGTTEYSFRSTGYPTMTFDGEGRSYLAFTTRGLAIPDFDAVGGDGRVVVTTSMDGTTWTGPLPIDEPETRGHQLMPALDFAQGRVFLLYYDFREDVSGVFDRFVTDLPVDATTPRHSVDVRAAQALAADMPVFTNYSVLDNNPPNPPGPSNPSTQTSRYPFVVLTEGGAPVGRQTQYNPPNLPMFKGGLVPFFGDFIDLAALDFVTDGAGNWDFNTDPARGAPVIHTVWTDNRDVVAPLDGDWTSYVPPGDGTPRQSIFDPGQMVPVCSPEADPLVVDRTRMRNQNIYTSRLTEGLAVSIPGNNRPLSMTLQRVFVTFLQNSTDTDKRFRLELADVPPGTTASFEQFATTAVTEVFEVVERNSSVARSIYVKSDQPSASVKINVVEVDEFDVPITDGLTAVARINPDPSAPAPTDNSILTAEDYAALVQSPGAFDPDIFNASLTDENVGLSKTSQNQIVGGTQYTAADQQFIQAALANLALLNPAILNPAIFNPAIFNPAILNPAILNPAIFNPAILNPAILNPAILNPAIFNPAIFNLGVSNPAILNPAIFNPAIFNSPLSDTALIETSVVVENTGNATAAYSLDLDLDEPPEGFLYQVIVSRTYEVPAVNGCELIETVEQEQLVNQLTPDVSGSGLNPDAASFYVAPGDNVLVTVRIVPDPANPGDPDDIDTVEELEDIAVRAAVVPQAVPTADVDLGITEPSPIPVIGSTIVGTVVDQAQPLINNTLGGLVLGGGATSEQKLAQVVTAGLSGTLDEVRLPVVCDSDLIVQIQGVSASGEPNGVVLTEEVIPAGSLPSFGGPATLRPLVFSDPAYFSAGQQFAIVLSSESLGGCVSFQAPPGNLYAEGNAFFDARPNPPGWVAFFGGTDDLPFETVVTTGPLFTFSYDNVIGNATGGTIEGTIRLDFVQSATGSGTGPASDFRITSAPANIPPTLENDDATNWATQGLNTFTVVSGQIVDYQFGASEGVSPTGNDNVTCFNNGSSFALGGVYFCGTNENWFGDVTRQVYNVDGKPAVTFGKAVTPVFSEIEITTDTDILSDGSLVVANNLGTGSAVTVNGVAFGVDQNGLVLQRQDATPPLWALSTGDFSTDAFSVPLDNILSGQRFIPTLESGSLTLDGLIAGETYRLQLLFSNDLNLTGNEIAVTAHGETYVLKDWQDKAINLQVEFTARSSSVVVGFAPGPDYVPGPPFNEPGRAGLNGYALHDIP